MEVQSNCILSEKQQEKKYISYININNLIQLKNEYFLPFKC